MDPQQMNYFSALLGAIGEFLRSYADLEDIVQAGFDLSIDDDLSQIDFQAEPSDLDHLSDGGVTAAFQAFTAVQTTMNANSRERWSQLLEVLRTWNR